MAENKTNKEKDKMAPGKKSRQQEANSTQTHLRFGEIRDNVLVLKTGGLRAILKTSSINFNLKSEQEQNSIIYSYQGFLNSLEFPIQILVRSKKLDIDNYIKQVKELGNKQQNPLLQDQTYEYAEYVKKLVDYADIMDKEFFVIVPYDPGRTEGGTTVFQDFFSRLSPKDNFADIKKRLEEFGNFKKTLNQRVNIVKSGLENCGLKVDQLKTPQIVELLYNSYNPKSSRTAKIGDVDKTDIQNDEQRIKELEKREETKK